MTTISIHQPVYLPWLGFFEKVISSEKFVFLDDVQFEKNQGVWKESTCNFPLGTVVEVTTFKALEIAWKQSNNSFEREHVFPYIQSHPKLFNISNIKSKKNLSNMRITVDKKNDLKFVKEIYKRISKKNKFITIEDIEKIISKEPLLLEINKDGHITNQYKKFLLMKEQKKNNV